MRTEIAGVVMQIYLLQKLTKYNEISNVCVFYGKPCIEDVRGYFSDSDEITDGDLEGLIGRRFDLPYDLSVYTMSVLHLDDDRVRLLLG